MYDNYDKEVKKNVFIRSSSQTLNNLSQETAAGVANAFHHVEGVALAVAGHCLADLRRQGLCRRLC